MGMNHHGPLLFISYPILWFDGGKKYICMQKLNLWFVAIVLAPFLF